MTAVGRAFALAVVALAASAAAQAQVQTVKPPIPLDAAQAARFHALLPELRCLVCQNESLQDSTAPLALDLKYEVRGLVAQGRSNAEIKKYLVARYGDFVLFKPPFEMRTALLWTGPFLLVLFGIAVVLLTLRRRPQPTAPVDREALRRLLDDGR